MKFNINENVRVRLTDYGRKIHLQRHLDLCAAIGKQLDYSPPKEDEEGWSEWQLWNLMETFGSSINLAEEPPFETTIDIVLPSD